MNKHKILNIIYMLKKFIFTESCHHATLILCANSIREWLLNNNLHINNSKTMLLYISLSNIVFPDIIFYNRLNILKIKFL